MIKTTLVDSGTGKQVKILPGLLGFETLVVATMPQLVGTFKAASSTIQTVTNIVTPDADGSLLITDILVSTGKSVGNTLVINFTDGSNTIKIMQFELTVAVQFGQSFIGCWRGWSDARIDMSADAAFTATVAIGYVKIPKISTLKYSEWDKLR